MCSRTWEQSCRGGSRTAPTTTTLRRNPCAMAWKRTHLARTKLPQLRGDPPGRPYIPGGAGSCVPRASPCGARGRRRRAPTGLHVAEPRVIHLSTESVLPRMYSRMHSGVRSQDWGPRCDSSVKNRRRKSRSAQRRYKKTANGEPLAVGKWRRGESNPRPEAVGGRVYMRSLVFCSRCQVSHGQDPW